jgi:hypothetical protein
MYVLDPAAVEGPDYPSETFRVLQKNELRDFGEYRTQRLILEAWTIWRAGSWGNKAAKLSSLPGE